MRFLSFLKIVRFVQIIRRSDSLAIGNQLLAIGCLLGGSQSFRSFKSTTPQTKRSEVTPWRDPQFSNSATLQLCNLAIQQLHNQPYPPFALPASNLNVDHPAFILCSDCSNHSDCSDCSARPGPKGSPSHYCSNLSNHSLFPPVADSDCSNHSNNSSLQY